MIFDTHSHYDDAKYDNDRDEVITSLKEKGVGAVCNVSCTPESIDAGLELTERYDFFYCSVGIHPDDIGKLPEDGLKMIAEKAAHEKVVAIGEIGLDYYWDVSERRLQKEWFANQMELARKLKLPLIIHSREAAADTFDIMHAQRAGEIGGVMHCYSYGPEYVKKYLDMDFYFGIGGVLTFKNSADLKEAVSMIPMDRIVLETDCPYLAPMPFRGKRNDSSYLKYVVQELSQIKGISTEEAEQITWDNAMRLYRLV